MELHCSMRCACAATAVAAAQKRHWRSKLELAIAIASVEYVILIVLCGGKGDCKHAKHMGRTCCENVSQRIRFRK